MLVISPCLCKSQSTKFQVGIEGGPSLSVIRYDEFLNHDTYSDIGLFYTIGAAFQYNMNNKLSIKTNLSFERKGYQNTSGSFHYRFEYLVLPVLLKVNFGKKNWAFTNFGPYIGYLISQSIKFNNYVYKGNDSPYKKIDLGLTFGIGANIPIYNQLGLTIELRDNLGLMNIEIGTEDQTYTNSTVIQFGIVYNFKKTNK
jgi:hypothetical protein